MSARAFFFGGLLGFSLHAVVCAADSADRDIPRWQPHDFTFASDAAVQAPLAVDFWAQVRRPDGSEFKILGFYDGRGEWKIRLAPDALGPWRLVTHGGLPALEGKTAAFTCVAAANPKVHGALRVDGRHPHHFVYEDGTRCFPLGYECDWLWALDMGEAALKTIDPFLDKLSQYGFNFVILNTYAHDTDWRKGTSGADDFGPPAMYAWEGTNEQPDHRRFNLAYWQHYDRVIDALYRRGITAHLLIKVYNKRVNWPAPGSPEDDQFFRWVIARYAAYPNVVWDLSKEANNEKSLDYKQGRLKFIRQHDPYHRLLTVHDDKKNVGEGVYDELMDFVTDQQHGKWHETILRQRGRRDWPIINAEFGYEPGPGGLEDKTYRVVQPVEEVVRRAWEISMAGGYTAYYYTYTAWDVIRPSDTPPGYGMFRRLRDFFETTHYWLLEPADALVSEGYCLAMTGKEYVVFQNTAKPFTLSVSDAAGKLRAQWYQPLTGEYRPAGELSNGRSSLVPPAEWNGKPVALHAQGREHDSGGPPDARPNIVLLLADQWRAKASGYAGDGNVKTPHLDRLAQQSIQFRNAVSVCPVCTPYRAALMTGRYPTSTGMFLNDAYLPDSELCAAEVLRQAGYATAYIGKWHLDGHGRTSYIPPERRQGWDYWKAAECDHNYEHSHYYEGNSPEKRFWEGYDAFAQTKDAQAYLRRHARTGMPFVLMVSYGVPHFPHQTAPPRFQELYPPEKIQLPPNVPDEMKAKARQEFQGYYAHCTALDQCLGELLVTLDETGLTENTILLFTSDHGEMMGSHGCPPYMKQVPWDEAARVPFLLRYPAVHGRGGRVLDTPLTTPDIFPTLFGLAGVRVPEDFEGEDLSGLIRGVRAASDRAALYMGVAPFAGKGHNQEYRAVRTSRYTYVRGIEGPWLLFDDQRDPYQMQNLAGKAEFAGLRNDLDGRLRAELKRIGDDFRPGQYYVATWGYEIGAHGSIPYTPNAKVQSPRRKPGE